jgi:DNA-binding response OmpR family regulator
MSQTAHRDVRAAGTAAAPLACVQAPDAQPKTVLIADDDDWLREMLMALLSEEGYRPLGARNGPETLHLARDRNPDVILLDVALPGASGLHVLQDLRSRSSTRHIPVMLVSGEIDLMETGQLHAADAAFHKPLDFGAFLSKVHETTDGLKATGA